MVSLLGNSEMLGNVWVSKGLANKDNTYKAFSATDKDSRELFK